MDWSISSMHYHAHQTASLCKLCADTVKYFGANQVDSPLAYVYAHIMYAVCFTAMQNCLNTPQSND